MKFIFILAGSLMLCCSPWCVAQQLAVTQGTHAALQANVTVDSRLVTLSDIAILSGATADQLKAYGKIQLVTAPQPGYTMHLGQREVQRLLHEGGVSNIVVDGAAASNIVTLAVQFDPVRLVQTAKSSLAAALQRPDLALDIVQNGTLPDIRLPRGEVSLRSRPIGADRPHSQMVVWVDVLLDGNFYRSVPVTLSVSGMQQVLVARSNLMKLQPVSCDNVDVELRDVAILSSGPLVGDCSSLHRRLRRSLNAGEVLQLGELEAIPAISEGESVTLQVVSGAVVLESRAMALTDGQVGQRISVRAALSQEPVLAMVVAPGIVNLSGK